MRDSRDTSEWSFPGQASLRRIDRWCDCPNNNTRRWAWWSAPELGILPAYGKLVSVLDDRRRAPSIELIEHLREPATFRVVFSKHFQLHRAVLHAGDPHADEPER